MKQENNIIQAAYTLARVRAVCQLVGRLYIVELRISPKSYYVEVTKPVKIVR